MADMLIDRLADDLVPVRPSRTFDGFLMLMLLAAFEAAVIVGLKLARGDLATAHGAMFWWKFAAPAALALAATLAAVRAGDPARRTVGTAWLGGVALIAVVVGLLFAPGVAAGTLDPPLGLACVGVAAALALPPALALGLLLRRGAPAHPQRAALAAAIAGGAWGALLLALHCPTDGAIHTLGWHTLGVLLPAAAAALPLARAARW